jgi:hypothetical protein
MDLIEAQLRAHLVSGGVNVTSLTILGENDVTTFDVLRLTTEAQMKELDINVGNRNKIAAAISLWTDRMDEEGNEEKDAQNIMKSLMRKGRVSASTTKDKTIVQALEETIPMLLTETAVKKAVKTERAWRRWYRKTCSKLTTENSDACREQLHNLNVLQMRVDRLAASKWGPAKEFLLLYLDDCSGDGFDLSEEATRELVDEVEQDERESQVKSLEDAISAGIKRISDTMAHLPEQPKKSHQPGRQTTSGGEAAEEGRKQAKLVKRLRRQLNKVKTETAAKPGSKKAAASSQDKKSVTFEKDEGDDSGSESGDSN